MLIQIVQQLLRVTKETVQIDLSEQQREILEILPAERLGSLVAEYQRVPDDILVVAEQRVTGKRFVLPEQLHLVQELMDVVLIQSFEFQRLQVLSQLVEAVHFEQRQ